MLIQTKADSCWLVLKIHQKPGPFHPVLPLLTLTVQRDGQVNLVIKTCWIFGFRFRRVKIFMILAHTGIFNAFVVFCISALNFVDVRSLSLLFLLFLSCWWCFYCFFRRYLAWCSKSTTHSLHPIGIIVLTPREFFPNYSCIMKEDAVIYSLELATLPLLKIWWAERLPQKTSIVHVLVVQLHQDWDGCDYKHKLILIMLI